MICSVCQRDAEMEAQWRFVGIGNMQEGLYVVESAVFTPNILQEILAHALAEALQDVSVDVSTAEYTSCEGCQLLDLHFRAARNAVLDLPIYAHLTYYESF